MGDKEQTKFLWTMIASILFIMVIVFGFYRDSYSHPMPDRSRMDCTGAYDYPICKRDYIPTLKPMPNIFGFLLGLAIAGAISTMFIYMSWNASILEDEWYFLDILPRKKKK